MADKYAAFISYAHCDQAWVRVLQANLERCLAGAGGGPAKVFLDEVDLAGGRSWVGQLQAGLDRSEKLVLVATPESLASPRVADEWQSFLATRRDWREGCLHIVHLVDTPLPPFLAQIQCVDFRKANEEHYRQGLRRLAAGLLGTTDGRNLPTLPASVEIPPPLFARLPPELRSRLVEWLAAVLAKRVLRLAVAPRLRLEPEKLEGQPTWACAASAALVWATGQEEAVTAGLRIVDTFREALEEDEPERVALLAPLREELAALQAQGPERGLLVAWLQGVAKDHERLVPLQEHVELGLLDRVYVQLDLRLDLRGASEPAPAARLAAAQTVRDVLLLDRREHPWITGRWVVLGDPGAGKTTLLRHFTATLARQQDRPWVPLFESLPRLMRERAFLLDRVVRRLERAGQPAQGLAEALDRAGRAGRLLLLLDGLDEVPKEDRDEVEQLLRDLAVRWPYTPVVVSSRPIGYRAPGSDFREIHLLPLDRERRGELLARWFGRWTGAPDHERAGEALRALDDPALNDLAGNPLYLTLMALLFEQGVAPDRNRTRLYDQVFSFLLDGKHRGAQPMERKETVRALLREIACGMTEENRDAEPVAALEDRLYRPALDALRDKLERVSRWRGRLRPFLDELAERTGILGPHDGPDTDWRFWHRTFREALTAESLRDHYRGQDGKAEVLARARAITVDEDQSRWAEPFALLAGWVDDPDDLVKALVEANRPLGLRALATAQRLRDETLREVLALSQKWEERAEVYGRLPELVGEPRRALALVDQLRRRTSNGNDLYFLDGAAQAVGRRFPEHARQAAAVSASLYNHIPNPPGKLFRSVDTPHRGRVPLWCEIPAGRFWMGSPEGEGDAEEHPRHQVTVARPFRCGAVPVTNAQYRAFDAEHESAAFEGVSPHDLLHHPVVDITWYEAVAFCRWISSCLAWARGARLPTEEEWEYACRAGSQTRYWSGNDEMDLAQVGWFAANSSGRTHRVGEKPANPWGLFDVHGNVWEWILIPWTDSYERREGGVIVDPAAVEVPADDAPSGEGRVLRGGSFWVAADWVRTAYRAFGVPAFGDVGRGFRVVLPAVPELSDVDR